MALGQVLLDTMETLDQELQLQSGESDVTRALLALNRAQDYFESVVAEEPDLFGDTTGTITTTASTETTAFPSGVLRLDRLSYINPTTSLPDYDLAPSRRTGNPRTSGFLYQYFYASSGQTGKPTGYWTDGRNIYWEPLPSGTHTVRWYGLQAATDISAGGSFLYPDICILPFASFATLVMKVGVGDETADLSAVASATFRPVVKTLSNFVRDGAQPFVYTRYHDT